MTIINLIFIIAVRGTNEINLNSEHYQLTLVAVSNKYEVRYYTLSLYNLLSTLRSQLVCKHKCYNKDHAVCNPFETRAINRVHEYERAQKLVCC